jgi:hypothetical protein
MKREWMAVAVAALVACVSAAEPEAVVVSGGSGDGDGQRIEVGVDLLAGRSATGEREKTWWQATREHVARNRWRYVLLAGAAVATDRVAANNDELWHRKESRGEGGRSSVNAGRTGGSDSRGGGVTLVLGDYNQNVNVVVVAPNGSASGSESNSGSTRSVHP